MRLTFELRFHTEYGQALFLIGEHELLGQGHLERALPLEYRDTNTWHATLTIPGPPPDTELVYSYVLRNADGSLTCDWGEDRRINPARLAKDSVRIIDSWNHAGFHENAFYTEPFKMVFLKANHTDVPVATCPQPTHTFNVKAPLLAKGETVCLLGNTNELKQWNTAAPILLSRAPNDVWFTVELALPPGPLPIAYKYGVYDLNKGSFVRFEDGENRLLTDSPNPGPATIIHDGFVRLPTDTWKGAGVAIPVFSLRTERSFGVGDFDDLISLVDWCKNVGLKLIQILPVNDTIATHTWQDSYPYAAISAFALHPLYLNLEALANRQNQAGLRKLEPERKRLNALAELDYEAVIKAKLDFARDVYAVEGAKTLKTAAYHEFFRQNQHWLVPYAVFSYLRDQYGTANFNEWPDHRRYEPDQLKDLLTEGSPSADAIAFHYFVQFHLHAQLQAASAYAHEQGLIIKGDIAIGVSPHGADVWQAPELFFKDMQAGAPPDPFAAKGQNWSFPTYNWPLMKTTGFDWWKRRFEQMSHYFDAFRIDHILGFFRIWSIPQHAVEGILGYFVPALPLRSGEFAALGIPFERDRLLRPYITDRVLTEMFGGETDPVKKQFLQIEASGRYSLRPEFATQRQIEKHFTQQEPAPSHSKLKLGLFDLVSNVILLQPDGAPDDEYHFRFDMHNTAAFRDLDPQTQARLRDMYLDYFYRRQEAFWRKQGLDKLPALKRDTQMLVCGEDLGMVPACVPEVMKELGLLSLEVQRMPKVAPHEFSSPKSAPYLSVVTPSTHDMSTIRGWWEEDEAVTRRFYHAELGQAGPPPAQCEPWINELIVQQHLASTAMWSVFQLQDLLGMDPALRRPNPHDERINVPANPKNQWRYRMHLPLESLREARPFNEKLKALVQASGR